MANESTPKRSTNQIIMEEKIDRLENHFKIYKQDLTDVKDILKKVENVLVGSNLNGNKGIIHLLDQVDERVDKMEKKLILFDDSFFNYKWSVRAIFGGIISFFIWFLTK